MNIQEAYDWLASLTNRGIRLGLEGLREVLRRLGEPQKSFAAIHIAGTNGKGSTSAFCASILIEASRAAGITTPVGLYTSPHLLRLTERIQYGTASGLGECSQQELADALTSVREASSDTGITFFEAITAAAFLIFSRNGVKLAVIETGMGGRLDATRLCEPFCSIITSIGMDHTEFLGNTLVAIAREKAGIFSPGVPAYAACDDDEVRDELLMQATATGTPLVFYGSHNFPAHFLPQELPLPGEHQYRNAALAVAAVRHIPPPWAGALSPSAIEAGLLHTRWPGRLEKLSSDPEFWVDAAHNPEGTQALYQWLKQNQKGRHLTVIFGVVAEKKIEDMLAPMHDATRIILTRPASARGKNPQEVFDSLPALLQKKAVVEESISNALDHARSLTPVQGLILGYGSIFMIAPLRNLVRHEPSDDFSLSDPGLINPNQKARY